MIRRIQETMPPARAGVVPVLALLATLFMAGISPAVQAAGKSADSGKTAADTPTGKLENGVRVIEMTAKRYEFIPSTVVVNQGDKVKLLVTSLDVTHGIKIKGYDINRRLPPHKTQTIEFTADKPGTHPFHCSVFCGFGHWHMRGKLIVLPKKTE